MLLALEGEWEDTGASLEASTLGSSTHIVPIRYFHRIGGAPPGTLPNFNYDAPEEVCGDRK